ncbi:hypothetical protein HDF26_000788 [Pedobacter cryoconitis]|uniref:hypothetical protein n=1 Tax=Pedobacter cryoconitis TaxID=188932 RepID=UPI00161ADC95|nr:hypothetical protein [Pedobacter cryoconitis]MBB6270361.1 hypothetical protein [Pedobacter cryoconitis]
MEHSKKELIKEIADLFEDYQETYVPGEWESFSKTKKKKYPFFSNWIRIAAVFLLMASVLPVVFQKIFRQEKNNTVAVVKPVVKSGTDSPAADTGSNISDDHTAAAIASGKISNSFSGELKSGLADAAAAVKDKKIASPLNTGFSIPDTIVSDRAKQKGAELALNVQNIQQKGSQGQYAKANSKSIIEPEVVRPVTGTKDTVAHVKRERLTTAEFLMAESKNAGKVLKKKESGSNWDFGLEVMPAATSANVNIGAGVTTAYRLSDKFSLSTGISYFQLEAGGIVPPQGGAGIAGVSAFSEKKVLAVDANLKAIDIPIALVYRLNKNYYTSAGVSYFNVVSERRSNTFEQNASVDKASFDPETGHPSTFKAVSVEQVDEPVSEKHLKGNSYIGFFNFSIGRQQNLFNKYKIRIEPFVKIPVGKLSSEDLKLTNSGIKFQLSF